MIGNSGDNFISGGAGDDYIVLGAGTGKTLQTATGGVGNDRFVVTADMKYTSIFGEEANSGTNDLIEFKDLVRDDFVITQKAEASTGDYTLSFYANGNLTLNVSSANNIEKFIFSDGSTLTTKDLLTPTDPADNAMIVTGSRGDDSIFTGSGNDILNDRAGNDLLKAGEGADQLSGGTGSDSFVFYTASESRPDAHDIIKDFAIGVDLIHLSEMDASTSVTGNQSFAFSGTTAQAYSVWQVKKSSGILVHGDIDGDAKADFIIELQTLTSIDQDSFIL